LTDEKITESPQIASNRKYKEIIFKEYNNKEENTFAKVVRENNVLIPYPIPTLVRE